MRPATAGTGTGRGGAEVHDHPKETSGDAGVPSLSAREPATPSPEGGGPAEGAVQSGERTSGVGGVEIKDRARTAEFGRKKKVFL